MTKLTFYSLTSAFRRSALAGRNAGGLAPGEDRPAGTLLICGATHVGTSRLAEALAGKAGPQARHSLRLHAQPWMIAQSDADADASPLSRLEALILADIVLLAVDARDLARDGMRDLLIRHHLFRRSGLVIALTAVDQTEDGRKRFETIHAEIAALFGDRQMPPVIALSGGSRETTGDDRVQADARPDGQAPGTPALSPAWFTGPRLIEVLEAEAARLTPEEKRPFRLAVTSVDPSRPEAPCVDGTVCQGFIAAGDEVRILPGGLLSSVSGLVTLERKEEDGAGPVALRLTLSAPAACQPGQIVVPANRPCEVTDQVEAAIAWFDRAPLVPGSYGLDLGGQSTFAAITRLRQAVDLDMTHAPAADSLGPSGIGIADIALETPLAFDVETNGLSCFQLTDPVCGRVVGLGRIRQALRRADNIHWQALTIDRHRRAAMKQQTPLVVWMTGLSGAGKSAIANLAEQKLAAAGRHTFLLDGDNVRHGLNRDLGFTEPERVENIRRVAEVARLMSDAGLIVLCAFISPFRSDRWMARKLMAAGEFVEVHVKASVEIAEARDPKGLYRKARAGELKNFTGIDSPYEEPEAAELVLDTSILSVQEAADLLVRHITDI
ncbi:adenylyl-sulfate kinase [Rhizobium rhizosphaerae]|uniref:Adenylyl-sulfate kinase n=1 Tax=Xaviernesmea rhizosphaerae TaxID=1672749 RepID=A0A1Q9ANS7_9HYPH|nr:adenylyl-sulfate kinase [Xaviernesmea rhizosphaerae]OLP56957.1 adenylyl-sulfate kinase [Xaviernesmea rhizosphaerae]